MVYIRKNQKNTRKRFFEASSITRALAIGGIIVGVLQSPATAMGALSNAQCLALAPGAECLALVGGIDGSYTKLAPGKTCSASLFSNGECVVKTATLQAKCPGACKISANSSAGETADLNGSKACAILSPTTPICAIAAAGTGTNNGPGTTSTGNGSSTGPGTTSTGNGSSTGPGTTSTGNGSSTGPGTTSTGNGSSTTTGTGNSAATGTVTTEFTNPLKYNTVQGFLGSVLSTLQGIVAILAIIFIIIGALLYITSAGNSKQTEAGKTAITAALIGLALVIAAPSFLKEIYTMIGGGNASIDCAGLSGADLTNCTSAQGALAGGLTLSDILTNVLNFLLGIVGIIALIMLIIGALMYVSAAGDEDRIDTGKKIVKYSVIGVIIAFSALVLVKQVAAFFV